MWVLLGLGAGLQFIEVIWAASKGYLGFFSMMVVIVTEMVITGSIYVIIYKFLIKPCNETRKLFKHFIQSGSFQELIDQDYQIFPEQNEADTTEALSTFFRYTITDTGNLVSVEDELENVENYFKIQQYRFGDKLDMRVNFPDDYARILECKLPKLTLQPVVENAIFHGLEAKAEGGVIIISLEMTEKKLLINIHDDGIGIDEEELIKINQRLEITSGPLTEEKRKRGGIALPNVSRRIKLLFGDEYGIHIYSIPNLGTEVRISVPIITNREQRNQ